MRSKTLAIAAALVLALLGSSVPGHAEAPVARIITSEADLLSGPQAQGQIGDYLLTNGDVTAIISSAGHPYGYSISGGHILDAVALPGTTDELGHCLTFFTPFPRQAVYDTVRIESEGATEPAVILARGHDSENAAIEVTTRYSLDADDTYLFVETTVVNGGAGVDDYTVGDAIDWGSSDSFAPGWGFDIGGWDMTVEWIGGAGDSASYAYARQFGNVYSTNGGNWSDPIVLSTDLDPGEDATGSRYFAIGGHGLSSASDIVHEIRYTSTGTIVGTVTDALVGSPVPGAALDCFTDGTAQYTQIRSGAAGAYGATLPPANYLIRAMASGHTPVYVETTVSMNQVTELDIELGVAGEGPAKGDTLTVVMRPILSVPAIVTDGDTFVIDAMAPSSTTGWTAALRHGSHEYTLPVLSSQYRADYGRWFLDARVPDGVPAEVYDLVVTGSGGVADTVAHSVAVRHSIDEDFYFVQVTDTHLPTHRYHDEPGAASDTTEMDDLRAVIEDLNLINPAFVVVTGDVVNEGELEDYLGWRVFTKTHRIMQEFEVPVYIVSGNHDIGGWWSTPPPAGSSRWAWWSFFGWRHLYDPSSAEGLRTQNFSFDYAGAHMIGMEAYINYDDWREEFYGSVSFTSPQFDWLLNDLSAADPAAAKIAFYHYDFDEQISPGALGIDCVLYGHTHGTWGQIEEPPFNLSTAAVCDGHRVMRLVRVSGNTVLPTEPIEAGEDGEKLEVTFDPANDGTAANITATITNLNTQTFEHGLVKFHVPADSIPCAVDNGEIVQTIVDGSIAICYVEVPIEAAATTTVTIEPGTGIPDGSDTRLAVLRQGFPNPARDSVWIEFVLASRMEASLEVFDLVGRHVATLAEGPANAGPNPVRWNLVDAEGLPVSSGVYFYRLEAGGQTITKKLVVMR